MKMKQIIPMILMIAASCCRGMAQDKSGLSNGES